MEEIQNEYQLSSPFKENVCVIKGKIEDHIIISVPRDMTNLSAKELFGKLPEEWRDKVLIVSENIKFVQTQRIKKQEVSLC